MRILVVLCLIFFCFSSFADECATTIDELRNLVGNEAFPMEWIESNDKNPFFLKIGEASSSILLSLATREGAWADISTRICKKNDNKFIAEVIKIHWGPTAPSIARGRSVKEVGIKLPYHSMLKISISFLWKGEFGPLD